MTHVVEADPLLLDPARWNGIDINDPAQFEGVTEPPCMWLTRRQERTAASDLKYVLGQVAAGDYTEVRATAGSRFAPNREQLPDGSVILTDEAHLMKYLPRDGRPRAHALTDPVSIPLQPPYAQQWAQSRLSEDANIAAVLGQEGTRFPDQEVFYGRYIRWGVLLSQEDGARAVTYWALGAPRGLSSNSASIRVPIWGRHLSPRGDLLPLDIGTAVAHPVLDLGTVAIRTITRINEARVIYPSSGSRERTASLAERLQAARELVGRILAPNPAPVAGS